MRIARTASSALLLTLAALLFASPGARAATVTEFYEGISLLTAPSEIAAGPDGNLWFTEHDADQIARITPAGVVTEFADGISLNSGPWGITSGPDGALWFTEYEGRMIGRITPDGVVTEFSAGISPNSNPREIVAGFDNDLWYTDPNGRRIGRITTAGVVTEFPHDFGAGPYAIARGRDGNIWFTEAQGGVGRITPAGVITRFPSIGSQGIAAAADGNIWTTGYFGPIQRMTPDGVITGTFPTPSYVSPRGITAGPDGNMWFTDGAFDSIGRITPSGSIALVVGGISVDSGPQAIVAGPDGNLWFTQPRLDLVSRVTPSIEPPVVAATDAVAITPTSATLNGMVDARSVLTDVRFEYGTTTAYGSFSTVQQAFEPSAEAISAALTGLQPATTYHYRLIATGGGGSAQSADRTFTTATPPPPPPPPRPPVPPVAPACSNGKDDDRDGLTDGTDPGCHSDANRRNTRSYVAQDSSESPIHDPLLACSAGGLALVSVEPTNRRRRVRVRGFADPGLARRSVGIHAAGRRVALARVTAGGSFSASFAAARRAPGQVRYQARVGAQRSQSLVAQRRLAGVRLRMAGAKVTLTGRTIGRRPRSVELLGRLGCAPFTRLATARVRAGGTFTLSAAPYANVDVATYRLRIAAAGAAGARESTPPRALKLR